MDIVLEQKMHWLDLATKSKYSIKKEFVKAYIYITSTTLELASKKPKIANENDNSKKFNII
jgi:disulfide oxidoreductase YuzD